MEITPKYIQTAENGRLQEKISQACKILKSCTLCPRHCKVDRTQNEIGICRAGNDLEISSYGPHFGEEPEISGVNGSGTVFFSHCSLRCCFCQNYDISILGQGLPAVPGQLASVMLELQKNGCHNINLVTPTHYVPQFLNDLEIAVAHGLSIPIVYNSSGYESIETLKILDGVIDIYMPDFKFADSTAAQMCCNASNYPLVAKAAIVEMHRQVGKLKTDHKDVACRGLLVRHLVMPDNLARSDLVFDFISKEVSAGTRINVMSQYHPAGKAHLSDKLNRRITPEEYRAAVKLAREAGLSLVR